MRSCSSNHSRVPGACDPSPTKSGFALQKRRTSSMVFPLERSITPPRSGSDPIRRPSLEERLLFIVAARFGLVFLSEAGQRVLHAPQVSLNLENVDQLEITDDERRPQNQQDAAQLG